MQQTRLIQGRPIGPEELALIRGWLEAHPSGTRTELSRQLCRLWGWRNQAGRLKDMACRSLLLQLQGLGYIKLPPRCTGSVNGLRNRPGAQIPHDQSPIECELKALGPLQVQPLAESSPDLALFKFLLQRYHYLGHRNGVGENLKYLARDCSGRALACLLFGSAAWRIGPRDYWIGWNSEQRGRHLPLLSNNSRFLILPWVRVPHLASHLLAQTARRLSDDWQQKYGHRIYLLETFVEGERFSGACYRAAGWFHVGATTGRTRNHPQHTAQAPVKEVYLKALSADCRRRLAS